jgi:hypothetical protein
MSNIKSTPTEWIYFFEEPTRHKGLIELGRTGRTVEDRNRDKRSVDEWREIASYPVVHCEQAEKEVIKETKKYRYNGRREILETNWTTLKTIVEPILNRYTDFEYKVRQSLPFLLDQYNNKNYWPTLNQWEETKKITEEKIRQRYTEEFHRVAKIKNLIPEQGKGEQPETFFMILGALMFFSGLIGATSGFGAVGLVISIAGAFLVYLTLKISEPGTIERHKEIMELHKQIDPKRDQEIEKLENNFKIGKDLIETIKNNAHLQIEIKLRDHLKKNINLPLLFPTPTIEKIKNETTKRKIKFMLFQINYYQHHEKFPDDGRSSMELLKMDYYVNKGFQIEDFNVNVVDGKIDYKDRAIFQNKLKLNLGDIMLYRLNQQLFKLNKK